MQDAILSLLSGTVRVSAPLVLAALAGLFSERGGVVDVGLEGKILLGAFAAAATASITGSAPLGLLAAVAAAGALGLVHGLACVTLRGNQVVSGMAVNVLASGLTVTLAVAWFRQGGQTPPLAPAQRFLALPLPGSDLLAGVPLLGRLFGTVLGGHAAPVYLAFALVPLAAFVLRRTRFGLRLRACGENPAAADAAGVSVTAMRYAGVMIAAVLCGITGAMISTALGAGFGRDMVAGRGFIALAALVLGKWRPWPTLLACLGFGFLDAATIRLQGTAVPGIGAFPVQALEALPYLLTVLLLAGFVGRAVPPRAAGAPYAGSG